MAAAATEGGLTEAGIRRDYQRYFITGRGLISAFDANGHEIPIVRL